MLLHPFLPKPSLPFLWATVELLGPNTDLKPTNFNNQQVGYFYQEVRYIFQISSSNMSVKLARMHILSKDINTSYLRTHEIRSMECVVPFWVFTDILCKTPVCGNSRECKAQYIICVARAYGMGVGVRGYFWVLASVLFRGPTWSIEVHAQHFHLLADGSSWFDGFYVPLLLSFANIWCHSRAK